VIPGNHDPWRCRAVCGQEAYFQGGASPAGSQTCSSAGPPGPLHWQRLCCAGGVVAACRCCAKAEAPRSHCLVCDISTFAPGRFNHRNPPSPMVSDPGFGHRELPTPTTRTHAVPTNRIDLSSLPGRRDRPTSALGRFGIGLKQVGRGLGTRLSTNGPLPRFRRLLAPVRLLVVSVCPWRRSLMLFPLAQPGRPALHHLHHRFKTVTTISGVEQCLREAIGSRSNEDHCCRTRRQASAWRGKPGCRICWSALEPRCCGSNGVIAPALPRSSRVAPAHRGAPVNPLVAAVGPAGCPATD